jgi:hypothetical protein
MPTIQLDYTGAEIDANLALAETALQPGDVDDTPVNGVTTAPISSNWAYDTDERLAAAEFVASPYLGAL